jgi:23S rRNA (cytidine1920-2'-O)/16S rRNA (cytidine1409-2'-O)-methyltransferase
VAARVRLDRELVRRGLADSREHAQRLIAAGRVTVAGAPAGKPATQVSPADAVVVAPQPGEWASRGGHKLAGALDALDVDPAGRHCLDAGASTGGFTDVLLRRGAARVVAVDVGYGQLAWPLRADDRVVVVDRTNVRHLDPAALPGPRAELVVADLSFISLKAVIPALRRAAAPTADFLLLVKPQFEVGQQRVGRGGVVRDPAAWSDALEGVVLAAAQLGLGLAGATASPLPGPAGNVEFFLHLREGGDAPVADTLAAAVAEGRALAGRAPAPGKGPVQ